MSLYFVYLGSVHLGSGLISYQCNYAYMYSICTDPAIQYPQANIIFLDLCKINKGSWSGSESSASERSLPFLAQESDIDTRLLKIVKKVASGSCGDM